MTIQDRLKLLTEQFRIDNISSEELVPELRGYLNMYGDPYFREKISFAVEWAECLSNPQKLELYGGRERVRDFLLNELDSAAYKAGELQRGE